MHSRRPNKEIVKLQFDLRMLIFSAFNPFSSHEINKPLLHKEEILQAISKIKKITSGSIDENFFLSLEYLLNAVFHLLQYNSQKLTANPSANLSYDASNMNLQLLGELIKKLDHTRPSIKSIIDIASKISAAQNLNQLEAPLKQLGRIILPIIYLTNENMYKESASFTRTEDNSDKLQPIESTIISVIFYFDKELWANPQIVKPNFQYPLSGVIRINNWPSNYDKLILRHVSTTNDNWFILSLPEITYNGNLQIPINGNVVFKYAQSTFDSPISIRLFAQFISSTEKPLFVDIIGHDQLTLKILDRNSFNYPTGYDKLNEKVLSIALRVNEELNGIENEELSDFLILLSSVLNYQGYCYQYSEYKNITTLSEDKFRDNLIKHLSANPQLSSNLSKEGHIAGGRVEINYKGIIAELKVENSISERTKLIEKYQKQPIAYASATGKRLSILCILDLTPKKNPPSSAANNVFFVKPSFHGFEESEPETDSLLAVVIIDANMPNPSAYA
jgi:hypothetical protein